MNQLLALKTEFSSIKGYYLSTGAKEAAMAVDQCLAALEDLTADVKEATVSERSMSALIEKAEQDLIGGYKDAADVDDFIREIADERTPIYYSDILAYAVDDIDLALNEPEIGPAFDGSPTPINIIASNIYETLMQALYTKWREIEAEELDDESN